MNEVNETVIDSVKIEQVAVTAYKVPTDAPEADGTLEWDSATIIIVVIEAGGRKGIALHRLT